jgi:hypothetical protein
MRVTYIAAFFVKLDISDFRINYTMRKKLIDIQRSLH